MKDVSNLGERVLKQQREARCSVETAIIPKSNNFFCDNSLKKRTKKRDLDFHFHQFFHQGPEFIASSWQRLLHNTASCATCAQGLIGTIGQI